MDEIQNEGLEGEYNEPATVSAITPHELADFETILRPPENGVVAAGDNSITSAIKLASSLSGTSTLSGAAPTRSALRAKTPAHSKKSADDERLDRGDKASFTLLKAHGDEVGLHDGRGAEARDRLICAAAATAADPSFCPARFCQANSLRFDKRTLASPLLGLIRAGLPESHRKLASKWAVGGAEALRTVSDAAALAAVLKEVGLEKFVRLARERKKNARVARGEAEPSAPPSVGLMLIGAPDTLSGRVTLTLNLHDGVADFIGVVAGPADGGSPPHRGSVDGQPAAVGNTAGPAIPDEDNPAAETSTFPVQGNACHSDDGVLGTEPRLSRDAPADLPPTRTIDQLDGAGWRQMPSGGGVQPPA